MERLSNKTTKLWVMLMQFGARIGCHQIAERSFFFKGYQFPICARCTGVLIGEVVSIICLISGFRLNFFYAIMSILPLAIDGGLQYIEILMSNNIRRIITGIIAGFGLTHVYFYAIEFIIDIVNRSVLTGFNIM